MGMIMKRITLLLGLVAISLGVFVAADSGYVQLFNARPTWAQFHTNQFNTNSSTVVIKDGALATNVTVRGVLTNVVNVGPWYELTYTGTTNVVVNSTNSNFFHLLVTNTAYITITNITAAGWTAWLQIEQDGTGGYSVTFDTNRFTAGNNNTFPTITTNANRIDLIGMLSLNSGTNAALFPNQNFTR